MAPRRACQHAESSHTAIARLTHRTFDSSHVDHRTYGRGISALTSCQREPARLPVAVRRLVQSCANGEQVHRGSAIDRGV